MITGGTTSATIEATTHHSHLRRKSSQHCILLDNNRERSLLLQLIDLDLARRGINRRHNTADCSKTTGHDLLGGETKRIFRAIAKRA